MRKILIALAAVAISAGFAANAATDKKADKKRESPKCEQKACPKECPACPEMKAFQGIELTDAQKDQLKALNAERRDAAQKAKEAKKEAKLAEKGAKADARRQCHQQYLEKVKAILTPEQYTRFLENQVTMGKGDNKHMNKGPRPGHKGDKGRQFNGRPERPQRPAKVEK